ncbi:MAG: hypothetical protein KDA57_15410 [Planctomycetales bacterium]|nr:hypothetical protein [Planctomycetales bacterium]
MTTERTLRAFDACRKLVVGKLLRAALVGLLLCASAQAQEPPVHWLHAGVMPPGAIGRQRLIRNVPLSGFCQPVAIRAPQGARIAAAAGSAFLQGQKDQLLVGLSIGPVYRFRVTEIPEHPGLEVFPTVELVDHLSPPPGQELRFPIPIELTIDELLLASTGRFITRVVYLEDPALAPAIARKHEEQPWIEAQPGEDPLAVADHLGRPMAILRLGGRVPLEGQVDDGFLYGSPPVQVYDPPKPDFATTTRFHGNQIEHAIHP